MMCQKPYRQGVMEYGCGVCHPCLLKRKRLWTTRLMLELHKHEVSSFVTLTYDKEHLPCDLSVNVRDVQLFLKRLRSLIIPRILRYYAVGEYGEISKRPHYHLALFGSVSADECRKCWPYGFVHVGSLTKQSAGYVVSYIVKYMTKKTDVRLQGRQPEFAIMSRKPGLGAGAVEDIARVITSKGGSLYVARSGDVPSVVRSEKSKMPLGRYLTRKLRESIGMDAHAPDKLVDDVARALQEKLRSEGARELHESERVQAGRRASGIIGRVQTKKGVVL